MNSILVSESATEPLLFSWDSPRRRRKLAIPGFSGAFLGRARRLLLHFSNRLSTHGHASATASSRRFDHVLRLKKAARCFAGSTRKILRLLLQLIVRRKQGSARCRRLSTCRPITRWNRLLKNIPPLERRFCASRLCQPAGARVRLFVRKRRFC